jgi:predicted DCC family thiol-disulfide oxidoreductase YuxK
MSDRPVVLYDGVCGFCNHAVQFLLRVDSRGELRFAALQSDYARGIIDRHPELETIDSVVYVTDPGTSDEKIAVRSDGALCALAHADRPWRWLRVAAVIPRPIRDKLYDGFAAIRYRVFGKLESCPIPSPEVRSRFLDESPRLG